MSVKPRRTVNRCDDRCTQCAYCERALYSRGDHEHDHFPVPFAAGGTMTWPACIGCHTLKDRMGVFDWPSEAISEAMRGTTTPEARIMLAKAISAAHVEMAERRALQEELDRVRGVSR